MTALMTGPRAGRIGAWWSLGLSCLRESPRRTVTMLVLLVTESVAVGLLAVSLRELTDGALRGQRATVGYAAAGAAVCLFVIGAGERSRLGLRGYLGERIGLRIDENVMAITARIPGISHVERPDYLDRIALVMGRGSALVQAVWAPLEALSTTLGLFFTVVLLAQIHPALSLMALFIVVPLLLNRAGHTRIRAAGMAAAEYDRLERHLFDQATSSSAGREIRLFGAGDMLLHRQRAAWEQATTLQYRARLRAAWLMFAGWALFLAVYLGGLAVVVALVVRDVRSPGDLVLAVTLAIQLRGQVERMMFGYSGLLAGLAVLEPYQWLRHRLGKPYRPGGGSRPVDRLRHGIRLQEVALRYPQGTHEAVTGVSTHLPAGSLVAVVGEYGSGKSTLVKLLLGLYQPSGGTIRVDGHDLADLEPGAWSGRCSAAFQDFMRYPVTLREAIGLGDPRAMADSDRIRAAARSGGADQLDAALPDGSDTRLGAALGGVELSEGQWQKVALARAAMPVAPLLLVLDEPTAALDAPSERAAFRRYGAVARDLGRRFGTITVLVSHRLTTMPEADLVLMMRDGRLVEQGDHATLMARQGPYAELFTLHQMVHPADLDEELP